MNGSRVRCVIGLLAVVFALAAPASASVPPVCLPPVEPAWGSGQMCTPATP